jgi:DNA replication protein DnaC
MSDQVCSRCGGTGWIIVQRDELSGAEPCGCAAVRRAQNLEAAANIPALYQNASLENFLLPQDNPTAHRQLAAVLVDVRAYTRDFPATPKPGLLLIGDPGTGKTHLAVATLRRLMAKGFAGIFYDFQNLLDRIRSGWDPSSGTADKEAYRNALESDILLLDDLGANRAAEWIEDTMTAIVTYRCNQRKPLIATTNLVDPDTGDALVSRSSTLPGKAEYRISLADRIGGRARSRLFEMCHIIRMPSVGDYRVRKSSQRRF